MSGENTNVDLSNIDNMSQSELEALEDEMHAAEVGEPASEPAAASVPEPPKQEDTQQNAEAGGDPTVEGGEGEAKSSAEQPSGEEPAATPGEGQPDPELVKHVSPPSKWAQQRHENKELKSKLTAAEEKAAQADTLQAELEQMKSEMTWMKSAIEGKGITLPTNPLDTFSDEKLTEIRDEFGDELADMFQATKAVLAANQGKMPAASQPAQPKDEPNAQAGPNQEPPAQPAAAPAAQPAQPQVDPALLEAIDNNDELSYWQENSPALWNRAVQMDGEMLKDPAYAGLPYDQRFAKVVEQVKNDVMKGAVPKTTQPQGDNTPPESLTGAGGDTPTPTGNKPIDRVLAAQTPDDQLKVYNSLSQAEKDEVDMALDI